MKDGFYRLAAASPTVSIADPAANAAAILTLAGAAYRAGVDAVVFPELSVTAYTCGDLFHNDALLSASRGALRTICYASGSMPGLLMVVGAPVRHGASLYNCAVFIADGTVLAVVPKTFIPNANEFYEKRWFASGADTTAAEVEIFDGAEVPFGTGMILRHKGVGIGAEICEDLWTPVPPSCRLAPAGAEVIVNLSASDDLIGKYSYLRSLVAQQSARCICAYGYASAGFGESTTDLVFDAKLFIAENGRYLSSNKRWQHGNQLIMADVDIEAIRRDRMHSTSYSDTASRTAPVTEVQSHAAPDEARDFGPEGLLRTVDPLPFVPADEHMEEACEEIIAIQVQALAQRLKATRCSNIVIGISGGLDSTLALLVACRTFDRIGLDRNGITGITMPGFGTTTRTRTNAHILMEALGVTVREIPIGAAVEQHFADLGHDPAVHDVTYENSQARERTQILMDAANQAGGMVLGTGALSELALGWATYNGDHMSMYGINAGIPKTLVRYLTRYLAETAAGAEVRRALLDIIDTPISPELIPSEPDGTIKQKTEDLVGPYELHDFFIYYMLRYGFGPRRIFLLACTAFGSRYSRAEILHWERTFFRRFFSQQFKRSCLPDGPKVGSVSLSPRGDWRMPSDASSAVWLRELDMIEA